MRLTSVEIHGFKSFADRTQLDFPAGLTAVVGPNGCGKSNVIDAIKWALGEQRPTALRGDDMLDVIFKGNGARPPRNFAEVSLSFDNASGVLPVEFSEVVITRRLFRSGESEYLINRQVVRLKDVRDLFMDTGLGTGAYSIMEQGRIDAILSADAQDRRRIFEEAAGISRYRARRRESESRLERTEQNLLRLGDVIDELEKQIRSLKNQAGRARSFLRVRDRLKALKARFYVHRWESLGRQVEALEAETAVHERAEHAARERLAAVRDELLALQGQLAAARAEVDAAAEAFRQATSSVEALGSRQGALRERQAEAQWSAAQLHARIEGLKAALAERARESSEVDGRLAALSGELQAGEAAAAAATGDEAQAEGALASWREASAGHRRAALERLAELTECRNRRSDASSRHAASAASHARIAERAAELRRQHGEASALQGELFAGARDLETALASGRHVAEQAAAERAAAESEQQRWDATLGATRERLAATESRRDALAELIARRDGVSPGAITLLQSSLPGIEGLVVDRLRAPRELAEAVEAALGATAEAVLVATRADALRALEHLGRAGAGRVLLLPRDTLRPRTGAAPGERLLDRLDILGERPALEALLGHVRLVPDHAALQDCPLDGATVWVTPQGDLLDERGLLRGGRVGGEGGLVSRRAECDALGVEAARLREELAVAQERRAAAELRLAAAVTRLAGAEQALRRSETERERAAERERQGAVRQEELARDLAVTEKDLAALSAELCSEELARDEATAREQELDVLVAEDRRQEAAAETRREALEAQLSSRRAALADARLQISTVRERLQAAETEGRQVQRAVEERQGELASAQDDLVRLGEQARSLAADLAEIQSRESDLTEARDGAAGELGARKAATAALGERLGKTQAQVSACETTLAETGDALSGQRLRQQEASIHRQTLREKVLEELEVDLETARPDLGVDAGPLPEVSDEGPDGDAEISEESRDGAGVEAAAAARDSAAGVAGVAGAQAAGALPAEGDAVDWAAVEREIEMLRERMARMANVNLAALDELREVEERHSFLANQRDDLVAARAALVDTIARVNRESRERFVATFEEIRGHFRQIFRKLFRGGKADVFLAEGEDVLEAGIEIVAAPPGKDARSITLLSGGERTLTAVGLLFALFRAKPSPVCMLDEVDAALDETNIDRFCTVLEDFLAGSQFLVVTHARRTMSYADTLYGITMQEHGISRALSLTLRDYDRERDAAPASAEVPAAAPGRRTIVAADGNGKPGRRIAEQEIGQSAG